MKKITKSFVLLFIVGITAFTSPLIAQSEILDIKESTIIWKGKKVLSSHSGTINLKEGYFEMEGDTLIGGKFIVDMTSIIVTDMEEKSKLKLEGHLKSDDFFGVIDYPTAILVINNATKNMDEYSVHGDITIKGVTENIDFSLTIVNHQATTYLKIDRSKFGIKYGSGSFFDDLGNKTISDIFELDIIFKF